MPQILTEKDIKALIKRTQKQVSRLPKKDTSGYDRTLNVRSDADDDQDTLDAQFAWAKKRTH